jgi:hypothetical protein
MSDLPTLLFKSHLAQEIWVANINQLTVSKRPRSRGAGKAKIRSQNVEPFLRHEPPKVRDLVSPADAEEYITELSLEISKRVGSKVGSNHLTQAKAALGELVTAFCISIGHEIAEDIMYFLYKHRR